MYIYTHNTYAYIIHTQKSIYVYIYIYLYNIYEYKLWIDMCVYILMDVNFSCCFSNAIVANFLCNLKYIYLLFKIQYTGFKLSQLQLLYPNQYFNTYTDKF